MVCQQITVLADINLIKNKWGVLKWKIIVCWYLSRLRSLIASTNACEDLLPTFSANVEECVKKVAIIIPTNCENARQDCINFSPPSDALLVGSLPRVIFLILVLRFATSFDARLKPCLSRASQGFGDCTLTLCGGQ